MISLTKIDGSPVLISPDIIMMVDAIDLAHHNGPVSRILLRDASFYVKEPISHIKDALQAIGWKQ